MNKQNVTIISVISILILISLNSVIGYSFLYPGNIEQIDNIRLPIQSKIMSSAGDLTTDEINIFKKNNQINPNTITITDLKPYISKLSTGDILFTNSEKYLSSEFIPGKWKHSIIYIGSKKEVRELFDTNSETYKKIEPHYITGNEKLIIDSSSQGVSIREYNKLSNLENNSFLVSIAAFKIKENEKNIKKMITFSVNQEGKKYDYDMLTSNHDSFYCSEFVYTALKEINIDIELEHKLINRDIIYPNDIVSYIVSDETNKFEMMFFIEKEENNIQEKKLNQII